MLAGVLARTAATRAVPLVVDGVRAKDTDAQSREAEGRRKQIFARC